VNHPRATLAAGMEVTPSVRLVSPLGAGGMGAVWLADHTALDTRVVVKFMLGALESSPSARARFKREAAAASQVKSPHVVQTFDYGVTSEGVPFIVMEHLEGRDLGAEILARGALEPATVVVIVAQVAKALAKAHGAGLLHRDIKPDNIFLCQSEGEEELFVKLLDFGIAKAHVPEGEAELDSQTKTGQVVGTPFYMSPEQMTAQKDIDLRSDLWSLGVVAFEALTGRRPYDGPSFGALAVKIATGEPPRPSDMNPALPPAVDAWFAKACAREPSQRFSSARELAEGLRAAFEGVVSLAPMTQAMSDSGPRRRSDAQPGTIPSAPPGPISVDDDARPRNSFVLASTLEPSASGRRGEPRDGPPARGKVLLPVAALLGIALAVAAGWKAKDQASDPERTPTKAASAKHAPTAASAGKTILVPARSAPVAAPPPSASASAPASASASAPASAAASASATPNDTLPVAPTAAQVAPPASAATAAHHDPGLGTITRPPAASARPPSASVPAAQPSTRPTSTATSHDDPLF
jgi:serine/threonine-protein kinase